MRLCYGAFRKLSTIPISAFLVGWGFYFAGFLRKMIKPTPLLPRWDNYPSIIAAGVGPVFVVSALLQACLGGTASAAVGSLTAAAAVVFLVSVGNSSITSAQTIYQYNSTSPSFGNGTLETPVFYVACTMVGSVICCLSLTVLLSLWACYRDPPRDEVDTPIVLLGDDTSSIDEREGEAICRSPWFPGYTRKLAVPCIALAFVGWGILVGGHYHRINSVPEEGRYSNDILTFDFGQWGACVLTPLLLLFGLLHAGTVGSASAVMGVVSAVMNGLVLVSIGYDVVHDVGGWLKRECESTCDYTLPRNAAALCEIVGSFFVFFFWGATVSLWPHYQKHRSRGSGREGGRGGGGGGYMGLVGSRSQQQRANSRGYEEEEDEEDDSEIKI